MTKAMRFLVAPILLAVLVACSGGGGQDGVATLSGSGSGGSTATTVSPDDAEKALLAWVTCMRGQGLDLPDPTVDAKGNLTLGGGRLPGGRPGGGANGAQQGGSPNFQRFQDGTKVCGSPPDGSFGFNQQDRTELQQSALKLSKCMREQGVTDFPDPDFSGFGPGAARSSGGAAPSGPFGDVKLDDPKIQAAMETCRKQLSDAGVELPGRGPGAGATNGSGSGN